MQIPIFSSILGVIGGRYWENFLEFSSLGSSLVDWRDEAQRPISLFLIAWDQFFRFPGFILNIDWQFDISATDKKNSSF
jgi:hypothetical protein